MGDWQELGQAVFIGLIFSFLVAKLISTAISFREDHLKIVREDDLIPETVETKRVVVESRVSDEGVGGGARVLDEHDDDDVGDDWEGIECTEVDELFSAATAFVAATAADRNSAKVSSDLQLQLYGLYKIATEGPCTRPQPSALKVSARAKWNAWQKLGAMPPEEAMEKYIGIVTELYPSWADGAINMKVLLIPAKLQKDQWDQFSAVLFMTKGRTLICKVLRKMDVIHACAREGEADNLLRHIDNGAPVNSRDSEGRTPLHWAVDRGHFNIAELLLNRNADVNAKDIEGQTPLHYAAVCDREAIAELLVKHNADTGLKDEDGNSPGDLCSSQWAFIASAK